MAEPDTIQAKKEKDGDEKISNRAHLVTPDPDKDPGRPKIGVIRKEEVHVDASPRKKKDDSGPMHVGVTFDANDA
ncbi:MAG: hypothetical protein H6509_12005 [Bryobacterales bacterium]|nr:hypothetical protein [Bryobacterales bacterium]